MQTMNLRNAKQIVNSKSRASLLDDYIESEIKAETTSTRGVDDELLDRDVNNDDMEAYVAPNESETDNTTDPDFNADEAEIRRDNDFRQSQIIASVARVTPYDNKPIDPNLWRTPWLIPNFAPDALNKQQTLAFKSLSSQQLDWILWDAKLTKNWYDKHQQLKPYAKGALADRIAEAYTFLAKFDEANAFWTLKSMAQQGQKALVSGISSQRWAERKKEQARTDDDLILANEMIANAKKQKLFGYLLTKAVETVWRKHGHKDGSIIDFKWEATAIKKAVNRNNSTNAVEAAFEADAKSADLGIDIESIAAECLGKGE